MGEFKRVFGNASGRGWWKDEFFGGVGEGRPTTMGDGRVEVKDQRAHGRGGGNNGLWGATPMDMMKAFLRGDREVVVRGKTWKGGREEVRDRMFPEDVDGGPVKKPRKPGRPRANGRFISSSEVDRRGGLGVEWV